MQRFEAKIEQGLGGGAYVMVPAEVATALHPIGLSGGPPWLRSATASGPDPLRPGSGRIPVRATFDGLEYTGSVVDMGTGPCLGVLKAIRTDLGKDVGDTLSVTLERDDTERTVEVPDDLAAALAAAGVRTSFDDLSYTNRRKHAGAVTGAKRPETRSRRIDAIVDLLREH